MTPSPSSGLSSPLSEADSTALPDVSPQVQVDSNDHDHIHQVAGSGSKSPLSDVGSRSQQGRSRSRSRSQRSPTSSTVGLDADERDGNEANDSDLTDMSDDENSNPGDDADAEAGVPAQKQEQEPEEDRAGSEEASSVSSSPPGSDSGSLSPPPDSVEKKPKPLPLTELPTTIPESVPVSTDGDLEDESELGSLTASNDSNADVEEEDPDADAAAEADAEADADADESATDDKPLVSDAVNLLGVGIEDAGPLDEEPQQEDAEEEDEEDDEGDVTMRADDGVLADLPNGTVTHASNSTEGDQQTDAGAQTALDSTDAEEMEQEQVGEQEGAEQEQEMEEQDDQEEEAEAEAAPSPAPSIQPFRPHSSHPAPPTTAAMRSLLALEIKFAALRDRLYVERMEETAAEEEMILSGEHPALGYLFKNLSARRERLHEVASRRHRQVLDELAKVREEEKECVWTWWTEERDREQWEEFEQTWAKRRRLIREKSELDIVPKRHKPVPKTWADAPKPLDWAAGAVPSTLSAKDAASDLAMMAPPRQPPLRQNAGPGMYGYPPSQQYYTNVPHQGPSEPVYASRVPLQQPHPQHAPTPASAMHRPQQHANQAAYGNALYNAEPRREGRTVPTTSGLFDTARRPPSNELPNHPGPSHAHAQQQPQPQQPPPQMPPQAKLDPWKQHHHHPHQHQYQHQQQHPQPPTPASASTMNGNSNGIAKGPSPVNGAVVTKEPSPTSASASAPASGPATVAPAVPAPTPAHDPNNRVGVRYPGLAPYLGANTPIAPPSQRRPPAPPISPPKSSLGITGVPTAMPFL